MEPSIKQVTVCRFIGSHKASIVSRKQRGNPPFPGPTCFRHPLLEFVGVSSVTFSMQTQPPFCARYPLFLQVDWFKGKPQGKSHRLRGPHLYLDTPMKPPLRQEGELAIVKAMPNFDG